MNLILAAILAIAWMSADSETVDNPLLFSLLQAGVPMSDGSSVKLPPPTMADGVDAGGQQAVIARLAGPHHPVEELIRKSIVAPFELAIRPVTTSAGKARAREVDLHFVAYGNWEAMKSKDFLDSLISMAGSKQTGPQSPEYGFISREALAKRGIEFSSKPGQEEGEFFATVSMFDRVELRATRHIVITRRPDSVTIAARLDPRFNGDAEYPNQWRAMKRDLDDPQKVAFGPPQAYVSAGFYGKITRLAQPSDAMLIEYHVVFEEPEAWFQGANLLSSKLPLVIQDVVRSFRRKLVNVADGKPRD